MIDDGLGRPDLSGRWVGFYRYLDARLGVFPIVAEVAQRGDRLSGLMHDQVSDRLK